MIGSSSFKSMERRAYEFNTNDLHFLPPNGHRSEADSANLDSWLIDSLESWL